MKRLLSCSLLVALLVIATAAVSAQRPIPDRYSIVVKGPCWLPDGEAVPEPVLLPIRLFLDKAKDPCGKLQRMAA